jgi:hypothetical protein
MVHVIADILKTRLSNLEWIEKFGGLVLPAVQPEYVQGADGAKIRTGEKIFPVACETSCAECWDNGVYKYFVPDSGKAAVGFFTDNGGSSLQQIEGPKLNYLKFTFNIRFLCWMNLQRLGVEGCTFSAYSSAYVIGQLFGRYTVAGLLGGSLEVTRIDQLRKDPAMFEPFSFAREGADRGLFLYPYDYFGLTISGTFVIAKNCLPALLEGWSPSDPGCYPSGDGTPCPPATISNYFDNAPEYASDEAAALDGYTGKYFWTLDSDFAADGTWHKRKDI